MQDQVLNRNVDKHESSHTWFESLILGPSWFSFVHALIVHKHILLTFVYKSKIQFWLLDMSTWKLKVALLYIYIPWHPKINLSMWRLYCGIGFFLFELPILVFFFVKIWHECFFMVKLKRWFWRRRLASCNPLGQSHFLRIGWLGIYNNVSWIYYSPTRFPFE
jgi:hypothetical protein